MKQNKVIVWLFQQTKPFILSILFLTFIGIIMAFTGVGSAITSRNLIDSAINRDKDRAITFGIVFFTTVIAQIGLRAVFSMSSTKVTERFSNSLRVSIYEHIARSDWNELIGFHSDDILTRLTSDISIVSGGIISVIPSIIMLGVQLVLAFVTLFAYDRVLALLAIIIGPVTVLFYRLFSKKLKKLHIKIQETEGKYRAYIHECIQNIGIIKVFSLEKNSTEKITGLQEDRMEWVLKRNRVNNAASAILSFGYYLGYMLSFVWGAYRLSMGVITYGMLTAFFTLVNQIQSPFISMARSLPQLIQTEGSATRLMELEKIKLEQMNNKAAVVEKAGIVLENIMFQYKDDKQVICDASADIKPGELVALVGASGEGKTTIIRLLLSLLEQKKGNISIVDGKKKYEMNASYRNLISYVPQGNTLFSGSNIENLRIGDPNATEIEIYQALKDACAMEFVSELKDGIHSIIGEKGIGLSEGQAQRLTIARALLRKAPILILDEATSALDEATELNVLNAIKSRKPKPTCLFITHRPTVYKQSDRILVLQDGILVEKTS